VPVVPVVPVVERRKMTSTRLERNYTAGMGWTFDLVLPLPPVVPLAERIK
jgi:hypothetical protein